jgi:hypothetical protein
MGIIPAQNKIQPTSNEQRNYTSSGTSSRRKIFIQPLNAQGEVMSIPTGHTVPYGYRKHCKLAENILKPEYFGIKNNSLNQLQSL